MLKPKAAATPLPSETVRVAEASEKAHAHEARVLEHIPACLERVKELVAEVRDLLDRTAQLALVDAVGPRLAPGVSRGGRRRVGHTNR